MYREVMWKDRPPDFPHDFTVHASSAPLLNQLSKNHSRPSALASALFLPFGARCRSDARGHSLLEARLPRARPLEVRRAVGCRSRSIVRSTTLVSSQRRCNSSRCKHHDLPPCLEPLSRLPFHGNHSPPENVHRNNFSKRIDHPLDTHSPSV